MKTDFRLDKKVKTKWLKALRSGKFKKGKEALKTGNKFCCLGVACEIGLAVPEKNSDSFCSQEFLPNNIQNFLATRNDGQHESDIGKGWSFKQIANWIEKNL